VNGKDATNAETLYRTIAVSPLGAALLALSPVTGRTHQIRVHASHAGAPLLGDRTYGGPTRQSLPSGRVLDLARIALHCARVTVPARSGPRAIVAEAPVPAELRDVWAALGGDPGAWDTALECTFDPTGSPP
jgi:23S rRNA pseudouridine955/2504/2580 synthase/23S rRNA pseudouridine1911/1915/1917 synthase